eukprot:961914-Pelagomonas_calceolata.AAC.1
MLPLCRLQLLSRPRVFTVIDFKQVHMPLVHTQLVGLPHAVDCCGPQCGGVISIASGRVRTAGGESRSLRKISWKE